MVLLHVPSSPAALPKKRRPVKVFARPGAAAIRIRDSRGIFELTKALKSADKALIVWTLRGWVAYNRSRKKNYRDGHYWTYNTLSTWQEKHFPWLSVKQLSTLMTQLVKQNVIIRSRRNVHSCYRYRVNEIALAAMCASLPSAESLTSQTAEQKRQMGERSAQTAEQSGETGEHTTALHQQKNLQKQKQQEQQQQQLLHTPDVQLNAASETDVVVVVAPLPPREPESITGEHSIDGEGPQSAPPHAPHGSALVKAMHRDNANDQEPSKVPLKVSRLAEKLRDEMGFMAGLAETLIRKHGAGRIRAIAKYIESQGSAIHTPPAYMRHELEFNELCLGFDDDESWDSAKRFASTANLSEPQPLTDYVAERIEELAAREFVPPLPQPVGWNERPGGGMTAGEIWKTAHHQLSLLFDRPSYDMWLRDARFIGFDASSTTFTIGVPSAHAQEMLQHRYYRNVHRVIEGLGNTPLTLVFEVSASTSLDISQQPLSASERDELHRLRELRTLV